MIIYCLDESIFHRDESLNKGVRDDIFVLINNVFYRISVYDRCRLIQDFDDEIFTSKNL